MERNTREKRPQCDAAARERRRLAAAVFTTCPAAIHIKDVQGRYVAVNRAWEALTGRSRNAVRGRTDFDLFPGEHAELRSMVDNSVLSKGRPEIIPEIVATGNEERILESLIFPLCHPSGTAWAIAGVAIDITQRKRAEEARQRSYEELRIKLAESARVNEELRTELARRTETECQLRAHEAHYRMLVENGTDIITILETDGTIRYASPAVERVLGYAPEDRTGKNIEAFVHPEDLPALKIALGRALRGETSQVAMEFRYRHRDGSWRVLESTVKCLLAESAAGGLVISSRDITRRRLAEDALRQKENELRESQTQLRALTACLLTSHEEAYREIARELHDDLDQKLAFLAIEAELAEQQTEVLPAPVRGYLQALRQHAFSLSEDVRRIAHRLHPAALDDLGLEPALRSYCTEFSARESISVEFKCQALPTLPPDIVLCLYRITQESLWNIAKHSQARRATLALARKSGSICLSIADSGIGFNPEERKGKGRLGIASMEERVRLVNGSLLIESTPGKGTRIEVFVPLPRRINEAPSCPSGR